MNTNFDYHEFKGMLLSLLKDDGETQRAISSVVEDAEPDIQDEVIDKLTNNDQFGSRIVTELLSQMLTHDSAEKLIDALGLDATDVKIEVRDKLAQDTDFTGKVAQQLLENYRSEDDEEPTSAPDFIATALAANSEFAVRVATSFASNQTFLTQVAQHCLGNDQFIAGVEKKLAGRIQASITTFLATLLNPSTNSSAITG